MMHGTVEAQDVAGRPVPERTRGDALCVKAEALCRVESVVAQVHEGLGNKDIGARLFISPRTVQSHLTHVYAKLGIASRVQLVQEASRRT